MTKRPRLEDMQRAGFPMGGEPLAALDLADTLMLAAQPPVDLIDSLATSVTWWKLQAPGLPEGPTPSPEATRALRAAIRDVLDAHLAGRPPQDTSIEDINAAAAAVPTSPRIVRTGTGTTTQTRWHTEHGGNAALAAVAHETIELLASPARLATLRRCANPSCSMLFLAATKRRTWCAANVCGNRVRVARHYERTRGA
ncbi:CGNR zinc finger domain-containing protein [Streptantibioticus ferralitis]|uniref:ABATE domain-containing protein n=1 Tax=Streptantibioticus ferralitis TaxID=236510 RepID=A0ABT5ZAV4_9ACTN|nr:ABATE domain-containing protein [Streptantibioticus ferralitis]MDF2260959.1 ABATE domain-containing protein [Streptantibioticus ferralitis]